MGSKSISDILIDTIRTSIVFLVDLYMTSVAEGQELLIPKDFRQVVFWKQFKRAFLLVRDLIKPVACCWFYRASGLCLTWLTTRHWYCTDFTILLLDDWFGMLSSIVIFFRSEQPRMDSVVSDIHCWEEEHEDEILHNKIRDLHRFVVVWKVTWRNSTLTNPKQLDLESAKQCKNYKNYFPKTIARKSKASRIMTVENMIK
jgi:hypothetical protein